MVDVQGTYLVSSNPIRERLLHTIAGDGPDNEVWEARLERDEQIQDSNLQGIVYVLMMTSSRLVREHFADLPVYAYSR